MQGASVDLWTQSRDVFWREFVEDGTNVVILTVAETTAHIAPTTSKSEAVLALLGVFTCLDGAL